MNFEDKVLICSCCGASFAFDTEEQQFFAAQGYTNTPGRCPDCRAGRKAEQGGGFGYYAHYSTQRMLYPVTCSECGDDTEVPFEPLDDRPVYCDQCRSSVISI